MCIVYVSIMYVKNEYIYSIYICVHVYKQIHVNAHLHVHANVHIHVHIDIYIYIYLYIYILWRRSGDLFKCRRCLSVVK